MAENFWTIVLSTGLILFISEIGDKTNLVAISLMGKTKRPMTVAFGATLGIIFTTLIAILLSKYVEEFFPSSFIPIISGLLFIFMGIIGLLQDEKHEIIKNENDLDDQNIQSFSIFSALMKSFSLVALAEMGDKSQLIVVSIALLEDPVAVLFGAVLGLGMVMFSSAVIGVKLIQNVPGEKIDLITSILFLLVGFWLIIYELIKII